MAKSTSVDQLSSQTACSRSEFQAQRAKLEALLRDAGRRLYRARMYLRVSAERPK